MAFSLVKMCISPNYTIPANVPSYIRKAIPYRYIFTEISDPMNQDTDGDKYEDKNDPSPCSNDIQIYSLKDSNYLPISDGYNMYYGGNQSWFAGAEHGDVIEPCGCGLIAIVDSLIYLSRNHTNGQTIFKQEQYPFLFTPQIDKNAYKKVVLDYYTKYYKFDNDFEANPIFISSSLIWFSKSNKTSLTGITTQIYGI